MSKTDIYETADLLEIVYLLCRGIPVERVRRENANSEQVVFQFPGQAECQKLVMDISTGNDLVSLSQAKAREKRARTLMHSV